MEKELEIQLAELWDAISETGGGEVWSNLSPQQWKLARDLFDLKIQNNFEYGKSN